MQKQHDATRSFIRTINTAIKYVVSGIMFVVCVTRTVPGWSILPAYFLVASILLGMFVKVLKRWTNHPRPGIVALASSSPLASSGGGGLVAPMSIVSGDSVGSSKKNNKHASDSSGDDDNENEQQTLRQQQQRSVGADAKRSFNEIDDDMGMPSSHSAMLAFFSWAAICGLCIYDALGLFSRAVAGVAAAFLPLIQAFVDSPILRLLVGQKGQAELDLLAQSRGGGRGADAFAFAMIIIMCCVALLCFGAMGAMLRVWNGDHTPAQALVGYVIGFLWCMLSVALELKVFSVNSASLTVQWVWTASAVVMGIIAAWYILLTKKQRRYADGSVKVL